MLKTTDGGSTWRRLDNGLDEDVHAVITDPSHLYNRPTAMRSGKAPGRSYRSFDVPELRRRSSWLPIAMEFQNEYSVPFAYDPADPSVGLGEWQPQQVARPRVQAEASLIRSRDAGDTHELNAGA